MTLNNIVVLGAERVESVGELNRLTKRRRVGVSELTDAIGRFSSLSSCECLYVQNKLERFLIKVNTTFASDICWSGAEVHASGGCWRFNPVQLKSFHRQVSCGITDIWLVI